MNARSSRSILAVLLALVFLLGGSRGSLRAGGGPSGVIVIYDPSDPVSVTIAGRYQQFRGIPEWNMMPFAFPAAGFAWTTAWDFAYWLRAARQAVAVFLKQEEEGAVLFGTDSFWGGWTCRARP